MSPNNKPLDSKTSEGKKIDKWIFFTPLVFIAFFCIWIFRDPQKAGEGLNVAYQFITNQLAWLYEWWYLIILIVCLYFIFGPYANRRLGDEEPEFSTFSWLGMVFTGVAGVGVLTWASFEFFYYLQSPPFGIAPFSKEAQTWALAFPLFHWGFVPYAMYTAAGLVFAYFFFVKKKDIIRPSSACEALIGKKNSENWVGKIIDILFVIGFTGGLVTCVGVNTPTIVGLFSAVFGLEPTITMQSIVILSWSFFMAILLYTGLKKGVRYLSDFRVYLGFGILAYILLFGPTVYILNSSTDAMGQQLQYFLRMCLNTDMAFKSGVPQNWTIFYWAWYLALAIQTGIFLARISRGRTVKEFVAGTLLAQTIGCWIFFLVFENFSMYVYEQGTVPIADILAAGGQGQAIVSIWSQLPWPVFILPILLIYGYIAMQTLLNAGVYTLSMVTTERLSGEEEPPQWLRIFWSIVMGVITIGLVLIGGIRPSQTTTVITSIPAMIIMVLVLVSFIKEIRVTWGNTEDKSK